MIRWLRERSAQEKLMLVLIAMLLICVAVRWTWVSSEIAGAFRDRFRAPAETATPSENQNTSADSVIHE